MLALYLAACHKPEAVTTVFKCSWGWTQKASETCRVILQLLINILPSCITLVLYIYIYYFVYWNARRSQWPRGLQPLACGDCGFESHRRHGSPSVVSVVCCQVEGRCDELITRPEESYRLWCVVVCDQETSSMRRPWPTGGCCAKKRRKTKTKPDKITVVK